MAEVNSKRVVVAGGSGVGAGTGAVAAGGSAKCSLWPRNRRTKRSAAAGSMRDAQRSSLEMPVARVAAEVRAATVASSKSLWGGTAAGGGVARGGATTIASSARGGRSTAGGRGSGDVSGGLGSSRGRPKR